MKRQEQNVMKTTISPFKFSLTHLIFRNKEFQETNIGESGRFKNQIPKYQRVNNQFGGSSISPLDLTDFPSHIIKWFFSTHVIKIPKILGKKVTFNQ